MHLYYIKLKVKINYSEYLKLKLPIKVHNKQAISKLPWHHLTTSEA